MQHVTLDTAHILSYTPPVAPKSGKAMAEDKAQINVRVDSSLLEQIDQKRVELRKSLGKIPSRSDVIRMAIEQFVRKET